MRSTFNQPFERIVPAITADGFNLRTGTTHLRVKGWYADRTAPAMFTLKMLGGDIDGLADQRSILLSASTAKALFGETGAIGKTLSLDDQWDAGVTTPLTVTGVYEDLPFNSSLHDVKYLLPWDLYASTNQWLDQQN
jgi:hypothetical protein